MLYNLLGMVTSIYFSFCEYLPSLSHLFSVFPRLIRIAHGNLHLLASIKVRVIGFPTDTVTSAEVAAFFSESAGLKGLKPTVVPAFKVVDILCPDELTACALAQRTGCSYNGGTVHMTRGDGVRVKPPQCTFFIKKKIRTPREH